ncbi:MAG: hypothetical protein EU530_02550 [Promethearchaeota archaeon]|nr:MAG: hypothetical protein EU530_02550 [Candidatus Lokiarchaeota archaeon]
MLSSIETLLLFNHKVDRLVNSVFLENIKRNPQHTVRFNAQNRGNNKWDLSTTNNLPSENTVDGFILTLRQFMQNNDPISIGNIAKIYDSESKLSNVKSDFDSHRANLNSYLNSGPRNQIIYNNKQLNRRDILWTLLYGHYAHSDEKYLKVSQTWLSNPILSGLIQMEFVDILVNIMNGLIKFKQINESAINLLNNTT